MYKLSPKEAKKRIYELATLIGSDQIQRALMARGLSFTLSYMLTSGKYKHEPKARVLNAIGGVLANYEKSK